MLGIPTIKVKHKSTSKAKRCLDFEAKKIYWYIYMVRPNVVNPVHFLPMCAQLPSPHLM